MAAVQGNKSHDAVDSGARGKIGGKATSSADPAGVAGADRVDAWYDVQGASVTDPRPATWVESASSISSAANSVSHASTSGQTHYLTGLNVTYRAAIYRQVDVYDGANVLFSFHGGSPSAPMTFSRPLKFTQGNKIVVVAAAASSASGENYINLFGYTKDD